jgi:hypothetical protein
MLESNTYTFGPKSGSPAAGVAWPAWPAGVAAVAGGAAAAAGEVNARDDAATRAAPDAAVRKLRRRTDREASGADSFRSVATDVVLSQGSGTYRCAMKRPPCGGSTGLVQDVI